MGNRDASSPPNSYCLAVCYCGQHDHHRPLPRPTITAPVVADVRQATSWAEREDETWLDK